MRYLNHDAVLAALTLQGAMRAVGQALAIQESGDYAMPERLGLGLGGTDKFLLMPCTAAQAAVAKVLTVYPRNPAAGRPMIQGLVLLVDAATGMFRALLDAPTVTAMRTGAVTGLSVRHLAAPDARSVGLVGCGAQGYYQVLYACAERPIDQIMLLSRSASSVDAMRLRLQEALPGVHIVAARDAADLMRSSEIVITATTARTPVLPDDPHHFEGKHCVAVGSFEPEVREYPDAVFQRAASVWVDTLYAMEESGELLQPLRRGLLRCDQVRALGEQIASGEQPDRGPWGTTFFKTVGMALLDLTAAQAACAAAERLGLGVEL